MMDGGHGFFSGGFMWLIWLFVIVGFVYLIKIMTTVTNSRDKREENPIGILNRRLANGEIDEDEYQRLKKNIEN